MIQNEVIEIQQVRKGTKVVNFFGTDNSDFNNLPLGFLIIDSVGNPISITNNESDLKYKRLENNTFRYDDTIKYITGKTSTETFDYELTDEQRGIARQKFIDINKNSYGDKNTFWVDFSNASVNDMYANISLIKSYDTLNTLSIINSVEGEPVFRESPTGIVFGKLEALQKISDENGNKIKIPLNNVPVCVFKTTDEFPDTSSVDDNGNRIVLNLKENSDESQYFDDDTFLFAQDFLTSTEQLKSIPDKYRYTALTNENGEFVIYDVPTGAQTFMLEIDLLKQGLTKDEVSLNVFPYPTTENPNVDNVPHFYYRQLNINVVPSWGDFQSGYTQLNVSIPLDLRKWTTYIFPPVAFSENEKLEVSVSKNANRKLKLQIRDMTTKDFPFKTLTLCKIETDLDRDIGAKYVWYNEFAENRRQVEYSEFGCYVLKLPANLYDINGFKTDSNGTPTKNKGLWLASYQIKEFIDDTLSSRATGAYSYWKDGKFYLISHFDLNFVAGNDVEHTAYPSETKLGEFPYEKPWSINYPEKYSIPYKPVKQRISDAASRQQYSNNVYFMEEPAYEDGDLLGIEVDGISGGFGVQYIPDPAGDGPGIFFANRISEVATKNFMYKYEKGVAWNETYANGYEPYWTTPSANNPFGGLSQVKQGEKFQRLECGYGYFLKPQGWPRYVRAPWGADVPAADIVNGSNVSSVPKTSPLGIIGDMYSPKKWINDTYNIEGQNLALALSNQTQIKRGGLDFYRIVDSGINNIVQPYNFIIPTYARLKINRASLAYSFTLTHIGEVAVKIKNRFGAGVYYYDKDDVIRYVERNSIIDLYPGKSMFLDGAGQYSNGATSSILWGTSLSLPGNSSFSPDLNQYTASVYRFRVTYVNTNAGDPGSKEFDFSVGSNTSIPTYWVRTETSGGEHGIVHDGISRDFDYNGNTYAGKDNNITRMFFEQYGDDLNDFHGYYLS